MTTGRINQVTILSPAARTPRGVHGSRGAPVPKDGQSRQVVGAGPRSTPSPSPLEGRSRPRRVRAIQLPPLSSPRDGPRQGVESARTRRIGPTLRHTALERRIPAVRHAERRLRTSVDPRMSFGTMLAIDQPSTDSFRAPEEKPQRSSGHPRPSASHCH